MGGCIDRSMTTADDDNRHNQPTLGHLILIEDEWINPVKIANIEIREAKMTF